MTSTESRTEKFVREFYSENGVTQPSHLGIQNIAPLVGLEVIIHPELSLFWNDTIVIREGTERQHWQRFGHEVCHFLRHCGDQRYMHELFIELQENQARNFAYHFCVPSFMLEEIDLPNNMAQSAGMIAKIFGVEYSFAERRIEQYYQKIGGFVWRV